MDCCLGLSCCLSIAGIEDVVVSKRRFQYEEAVKAEPLNYDHWFDYLRLEEGTGEGCAGGK